MKRIQTWKQRSSGAYGAKRRGVEGGGDKRGMGVGKVKDGIMGVREKDLSRVL